MAAMVAGRLIPVGGQAATVLIVAKEAMTYGGILTSTLGSVGVIVLYFTLYITNKDMFYTE